jgi:hypothetical protein
VSPSNACFDSITGFLLAVALGREVLVLRVEYVDTLFGNVNAPVRLTCTFTCGVLQRSVSTVCRHGDVLARLRGHSAEVAVVHFDPHKSHILASCAEDGMLKVTSLSRKPERSKGAEHTGLLPLLGK